MHVHWRWRRRMQRIKLQPRPARARSPLVPRRIDATVLLDWYRACRRVQITYTSIIVN